MKRKLHTLTLEEYQLLIASGMMWELYPECTGNYYKDCKNKNAM